MNNDGRKALDDLNKSIESLEKTAGHDIHSDKWKRCVEHVKEQGDVDNAYAVCTASLGPDAMKSFAKSSDLTEDEIMRIDMNLLKSQTEKLMSLVKGEAPESPGLSAEETGEETSNPTEGGTALGMAKVEKTFDPHNNYIVTPTIDALWGQSPMPSPLDATQGIDILEKNRERF